MCTLYCLHLTLSQYSIFLVIGREVECWTNIVLSCFVTSDLAKPEESWLGVWREGRKGTEAMAPATHIAISRF